MYCVYVDSELVRRMYICYSVPVHARHIGLHFAVDVLTLTLRP